MQSDRIRRTRALSALSFLFVLAVCAAIAAHERLHDLELAAEGHPSGHHDSVEHDHPALARTANTAPDALVVVGTVTAVESPAVAQELTALPLLRPGPPLVDDDVGLHDLLSVYRI